MLKVLSDRPVRRQFEYEDDFDFGMTRYHVAAENSSKGIVKDPPCTNCWQGVAPETRSLRKFIASGLSQHYLTAGLAVYPECVSSTVEDGADPNDSETRWFAGGGCASC